MLGIDFLKSNSPLNFAGMEFMDYVSSDLYPNLTKFFQEHIVKSEEDFDAEKLEVTKESVEAFHGIIFAATGMNTLLSSSSTIGNMGVDVGFLSPNNLMNTPIYDQILEKEDTNVARAMKILKTDVLKGWVDTSTGRIGGDYSKIQFRMAVNPWVDEILSRKILTRLKCSMSEALAMTVIHELGHIFSGLLFVTRTTFDSVLPVIAIKTIDREKAYGRERAIIVNDALKALEIPPAARSEDLDKMGSDELALYFSKAITNRDMHRTLSLGTADRGSEVFADLYAVRFGCPKAMVAVIASLETSLPDKILTVASAMIIGMALTGSTVLTGFGGVIMFSTILLHVGSHLIPNNTYDSQYRRMKNILRDTIVRLNEDKTIDKRQKLKLLADAKEMEKNVDDAKKFFEGTGVQRVLGYIFSGTDYRPQEFEHYTDELIGHSLSLYKETF